MLGICSAYLFVPDLIMQIIPDTETCSVRTVRSPYVYRA